MWMKLIHPIISNLIIAHTHRHLFTNPKNMRKST